MYGNNPTSGTATWYILAIMANRRRRQQQQQEQQQALSPPQLQAISAAMTDAVTQALQRPGSSPNPQLAAGTAPPATTPIASSVTTARYYKCLGSYGAPFIGSHPIFCFCTNVASVCTVCMQLPRIWK